MDTFLISQLSFWWAKYTIKPSKVVDKIIEVAVEILVPPRESNEKGYHNWLMSRFHSIDRAAEKFDKEGKLRNDLARWDRENPELRHEMIVGTLVSGIISIAATNIYLSFCRRVRSHGNSRY